MEGRMKGIVSCIALWPIPLSEIVGAEIAQDNQR